MKVSDLKVKPFEMECCKYDCKNKDIKKCVNPLCITLAIVNGLIDDKNNSKE